MNTKHHSYLNGRTSGIVVGEAKPTRLIRLPEVKHLTGLSRTQIYRLEARGDFPKRVKLGNAPASATAFIEAEIEQFLAERIAASRA